MQSKCKKFKITKVKGRFRTRRWAFSKQIKSDFIFQKKKKCIRTIWEQSYYTYNELLEKETQNELDYWKYHIKRKSSDGKGGIFVEWFDSYIPENDIVSSN